MQQVVPKSNARLLTFWLITYPLFFLVILSYGKYLDWNKGTDFLYFLGLSIAQAGVFSWVCVILLPIILYWLMLKKLPLQYITIIFTTCSLFLLCLDRFVFSQFQTHMDQTIFSMILSPVRAQVFDLSRADYFSMMFVFILLGILNCCLDRLARRTPVPQLSIIGLSCFICFCLVSTQLTYAWGDAVYKPKILAASELCPGFYGMTAKRFFTRYHLVDVSNRPARVKVSGASKINYPKHPLTFTALVQRPNILIIALDAWRYDSFNAINTPAIHHFAHSASRYHNHYSGGNSTRAGIFSLFYGVSPADFDAFYKTGTGPVLFDALYKQGYQVEIYPSASALSPPFHRTAFNNVKNFEPTTIGIDSVERDINITHKIKKLIQQTNDQPFFSFVFYDSAHAYNYPRELKVPYSPSAKVSHLTLSNPEQQIRHRNQYQNALFFVDTLVGQVLDSLRDKGILDNTMVIVTGDHGEEFDDNGLGYWGHNGNFTPVQTHVPLIVHWPSQQIGLQHQHVTTHYDITATLLKDFLGVVNPISDFSIGMLIEDTSMRRMIIMGSYGKIALFSPQQALIVVINRLGMFKTENLHGVSIENAQLPADLFKLGFEQINHFYHSNRLQ